MKTREIADVVGGELVGDGDINILGVAAFSTASAGEIAFFEKESDLSTNASCVLVPMSYSGHFEPAIKVKDPKLAFAKAAGLLHQPKTRDPQRHSSAVI